jgi:hypothetical protein
MQQDIIIKFLEKNMAWSNKETIPFVKIISINEQGGNIKVFYDVIFKLKDNYSNLKEYSYRKNVECILSKDILVEFNRNFILTELIG